eukprot:218629-Lingulodinium_polyedra.AAC.1
MEPCPSIRRHRARPATPGALPHGAPRRRALSGRPSKGPPWQQAVLLDHQHDRAVVQVSHP